MGITVAAEALFAWKPQVLPRLVSSPTLGVSSA